MNASRAIGIAVLGYGRIGRIHADNVRREPSARLVVVADPAFASGGKAPEDCAWTADVDSVFAHPDVDAVLICTPTPTHARFLELAAAARKDIFCEKPIDLDPAVAARAVAAVERAGVKLQVGFNRRFDPSFRAVRDAIASGEIGTLAMLRVISRDPSPPPPEYVASSGGLFLDMTIHDFDMVRFLSGREVVEAHAFAAVRVDPRIGEAGDVDTALLSLKLDTGALALIDNSRRAVYGYDQRVAAFGSDGAIEAGNRNAESTVFSGPRRRSQGQAARLLHRALRSGLPRRARGFPPGASRRIGDRVRRPRGACAARHRPGGESFARLRSSRAGRRYLSLSERLRSIFAFLATGPDRPVLADEAEVDRLYRRHRLRIMLAITIGYAIAYTCRLALSVVKKPLIDEGIFTAAELGLIGSGLFYAYAFGKLVNGFLADHANLRYFFALGVLISALLNVGMGFSTTLALSILLWSLNGWFQGFGAPSGVVAMANWFTSEERGRRYGVWSTAHSLGEGLTFIGVAGLVTAVRLAGRILGAGAALRARRHWHGLADAGPAGDARPASGPRLARADQGSRARGGIGARGDRSGEHLERAAQDLPPPGDLDPRAVERA